MVVRRAHLVGSIPAPTAAEAMRLAADRLGPDLDYLPDGQTGERRNWVISMIDRFRDHPDLRLAKPETGRITRTRTNKLSCASAT